MKAGISNSHLALMPQQSMSAITENALYFMPAETVNLFRLKHYQGLSKSQLNTLQMSKNSAGFTTQTKDLIYFFINNVASHLSGSRFLNLLVILITLMFYFK